MDERKEIVLVIPESIPLDIQTICNYRAFLQACLNRRCVGALRYGGITKKQRYATRLKLEIKAYERTGNIEHLLNCSVYCFLESEAPQNKKAHWNALVKSVTRGRV
jgi:hypothetical protein